MPARGDQLERGSVISGYRIDELISRGGMGVVYRATNVAMNRIYALKVLAPELADDERFRERFKREVRVAASLHHPNVVGIHYAGEHEGLLFLAMDFVYGTDLREVLRKSGALEPSRAVELLAQLGSALDAAHGEGLVHRDVKPANVLITVRDGEEHAYLTDFGVAKRFDTVSDLTATGVVVGTVDYMSPEQITGGRTDARTDIYALGCVFFQMLSGKVPYERENSVAKLFAHVHDPPPPLEGALVDLYPTFGGVIEKAMAKEPGDRYLSAGDFARDAAAALRGTRYEGPPTIVATGDATPTGKTRTAVERGAGADGEPPTKRPATAVPRIGGGDTRRRSGRRYRWPVLAASVLLLGTAAVIALTSGSSSSTPPGDSFASAARPVPENRVTGSGTATVHLQSNVVTVTVDTNGLLNGSPHAMHIHAGGQGICPPAAAARLHNGHLSISTTDGIKFYGPPQTSLTKRGDTSVKSIVDFSRYPTEGRIRYKRSLTIPPGIATAIRAGSAVIVVHGIDYNGNGIYDDVLSRSELNTGLPGEATAPALCGPLFGTQTAASGQRPTGTTYTASLRVRVPSSTAEPNSLWMVCHLPPPAPEVTGAPASAESVPRAPA